MKRPVGQQVELLITLEDAEAEGISEMVDSYVEGDEGESAFAAAEKSTRFSTSCSLM